MLELQGVRAGYGVGTVLWDVELRLEEGAVLCLLGRNGAGKTTLAHVVTGLLRCSAGRIGFRGQDITRRTPESRARSGIALVPQGRRVFPDLTVAENLAVARMAAAGRARRETAELVGLLFPKLTALRARRAGTLSGGEQQMVAMGRALMTEPALLVLDEPSLGLAPRVVDEMYEAIRRLKEERNLTMLLVEQQLRGALAVADDLAVLESGRIVERRRTADGGDLDSIIDAYLGGSEAKSLEELDTISPLRGANAS